MFDALIATMIDTRLEPDLEDLCWSLANLFHRSEFRIQRELDDNEDAQKRSQREQDGSEVKSVELERQIREGIGLIERRNAMEFMREAAADQFEAHFRKAWTPRTGSLVNHRTLTRLKQSGVNMSRTLGCKSLIICEPALGDEKV